MESFLFNHKDKQSDKHYDVINKFQKEICYKNERYVAPLLWRSDSDKQNLCNNYEVMGKKICGFGKAIKG